MKTKQQLEQPTEDQKARALVIGVSNVTESTALVNSDSGKIYEVDFIKKTCDCPHYRFRQAFCKHQGAVKMFLEERE